MIDEVANACQVVCGLCCKNNEKFNFKVKNNKNKKRNSSNTNNGNNKRTANGSKKKNGNGKQNGNNNKKNCSWITNNAKRRKKYCFNWQNKLKVQTNCPAACNLCRDPIPKDVSIFQEVMFLMRVKIL